MFSEIWFWLYVVTIVLGSTCPFTSPLGSILSIIGMLARYVFVGILFFLAPHWWYGLVMLLVYFLLIVLIPKINPYDIKSNIVFFIYSQVGSHVAPLLVVLMYLYFFNIL